MRYDATSAEHDADGAAGQADGHRFGQELPGHVAAAGADRHAQPDLACVRSVTDSSVMFMMPMPPTSSDTAATAASSQRIVPLARSRVPASCSSVTRSSSLTLPAMAAATFGGRPPVAIARVACVEMVKSSGFSARDAVALAQQRR